MIPGEMHAPNPENSEEHIKANPKELVYQDIATVRTSDHETFADVKVDVTPELPLPNMKPALQVYDVVSSERVLAFSSHTDDSSEATYNVLNHNLSTPHAGNFHSKKCLNTREAEHTQAYPKQMPNTQADGDVGGVVTNGNLNRNITYSTVGCYSTTDQPFPTELPGPTTEQGENEATPVYSVVDKSKKKQCQTYPALPLDAENIPTDSVEGDGLQKYEVTISEDHQPKSDPE